MANLTDVAKAAMIIVNPVPWMITEGLKKATESISNASDQGLVQLEQEVAKQNFKMRIAEQQARVEQELAIARRIDNAIEVEIEEFYDTTGKGNLGLTVDGNSQTASIGIGAEGRLVTKRIYHFKGLQTQKHDTSSQVQ